MLFSGNKWKGAEADNNGKRSLDAGGDNGIRRFLLKENRTKIYWQGRMPDQVNLCKPEVGVMSGMPLRGLIVLGKFSYRIVDWAC